MSTIEMELRRFHMDDFTDLNSWYYRRKGENFPMRYLSPTGVIVPGVAAGFLIQTDAHFGILEPFISNPEASKEDRDRALHMILERLTSMAKKIDYKVIYGFSTNKIMLDRAISQGFEIQELNSTTVKKVL